MLKSGFEKTIHSNISQYQMFKIQQEQQLHERRKSNSINQTKCYKHLSYVSEHSAIYYVQNLINAPFNFKLIECFIRSYQIP